MKILHVNCVYDFGSTGKIVSSVHRELLSNGINSVACYARGKNNAVATYKISYDLESKIHSLLKRIGVSLPLGGMPFSTLRLIKRIKKENPDIVHIHCLNAGTVNLYKLLEFLGKRNVKTIVTLHAEFMYTGSCEHAFDCTKWKNAGGCKSCPEPVRATSRYIGDCTPKAWRKLKKAYSQFNAGCLRFTAVSPWVKDRFAKTAIIKAKHCDVVLNGLDTDVMKYIPDSENESNDLRPEGQNTILHVTAFFNPDDTGSLKGGKYIADLAERMPQSRFIVVASRAQVSSRLSANITIFENINSLKKMAELYSLADLTVITSRRETFSMVCAESLSCGTPVVGFKAGGPESISMPECSKFVEYGNIDSLEKSIKELLSRNYDKKKISAEAHRLYSRERMTSEYLHIYKSFRS